MSLKDTREESLKSNKDEYSVSAYKGTLEPAVLGQNMNKLKVSFPKMSSEFFNVLAERIVANGFTNERLKDAVNHVLDNFQYKELTISDIVKFDKRVKLYTYNEVCVLVTKNQASFEDFEVKRINGSYFRIKKTDIQTATK